MSNITQDPRISQRWLRRSHLLGYNAIQSVECQPMFQRQRFPPRRELTFNGLHAIISQKMQFFIQHNISIRTSEDKSMFSADEPCHFELKFVSTHLATVHKMDSCSVTFCPISLLHF
jgi:hypothetical protein